MNMNEEDVKATARMREEHQREVDRIDELYQGLSPYNIRQCVIWACEAFVSNLNMSDILRMGEESNYGRQFHIDLMDHKVLDSGYESQIVEDLRWDRENPGVIENAPNVKDYRVVSDTGKEV